MLKKAAVSYADDPDLAQLTEAEAAASALPGVAEIGDDYRLLARVHFWLGRCHWYKSEYAGG